jgi:hypothetical protein
MRKALPVFLVVFAALAGYGQVPEKNSKPFSTWSIHTPDIIIEGRSPYPVGVLTPTKSISIRRVEILSNRGPSNGRIPSGEPIPCPVQYTLEITNGVVTQRVPISNAFIGKKTSQTYTDSGLLNLSFTEGNRITVSMVAPKPQFPPVTCELQGLDISIQYELADEPVGTENK